MRQPNFNFVRSRPRDESASVLLARKNFGCGSSRQHAPWALDQYGFCAQIAPSYADIYFNNCFQNGVLPIVLSEAHVSELFDEVAATPGYRLTVDLPRQVVVKPDRTELAFDAQPFCEYRRANGFDNIGPTLRHAAKIRAFADRRLTRMH